MEKGRISGIETMTGIFLSMALGVLMYKGFEEMFDDGIGSEPEAVCVTDQNETSLWRDRDTTNPPGADITLP